MTSRQFEKKASEVLKKYEKYRLAGYKVWREKDQFFFSVRFDPDRFRKQVWGVSAVFDRDGRLVKSSYGSIRDFLFTAILMKRIEEACVCSKEKK